MSIGSWLVILFSALAAAGSLFIVASGLTLVFGSMRVINLAHGSFYMFAAYIVTTITGSLSSNMFWVALVAAPLVVGGMGLVLEVTLMRRIYEKEHLLQLVTTYGVLFILADVALIIWGANPRSATPPPELTGSVSVASSVFPIYDIFAFGVALGVAIGLWLLLQHTMVGWMVKGSVDDRELLTLQGARVRALSTAVFTVGCSLAGIGGVIIAPLTSIAPGMDESILVSAFIVVVIGGMGSIVGAGVGALIIGIADGVGTIWLPQWEAVFLYLVMMVVLVARPRGLFGRTAEGT